MGPGGLPWELCEERGLRCGHAGGSEWKCFGLREGQGCRDLGGPTGETEPHRAASAQVSEEKPQPLPSFPSGEPLQKFSAISERVITIPF